MNEDQAIEIIEDIMKDNGEPMLETLKYMQDNLDQFEPRQVRAFEVLMKGLRQLFQVRPDHDA